jgi:hypothetical protein
MKLLQSGLMLLSFTSCSIVQTLQMDTRLFVRVPGPVPAEREPRQVVNGWHFKHLVQGPSAKQPEAQWYLVWHDSGKDQTHGVMSMAHAWRKAEKLAPEIADATFQLLHVYPQVVEPNLICRPDKVVQRASSKNGASARGETDRIQVKKLPMSLWPSRMNADGQHLPSWHLASDAAQLQDARQETRRRAPGGLEKIHVGILDNGFDNRHAALPASLHEEREADLKNLLACMSGHCNLLGPGDSHASHGMGTLGILAGTRRTFVDPNPRKDGKPRVVPLTTELGGVPEAQIYPVRIAPWVASFSTANFAAAVDYASRVKKCDVLSMSHGGGPSLMWMDAINAAYDRGTAMFAATGDYVNFPWMRLGIGVPSSSVYPAACRRVIGVGAVTADGSPYGVSTWKAKLLHFWNITFMRGSYGADGVWRNLTDHALSEELGGKIDQVEVKHLGQLRAAPLSAYAPGIPWLVLPEKDGTGNDRVDLDGGGASAATPQVAAAAALWLATHRQEMGEKNWQSWQKVEAVYDALLLSAARPWAAATTRKEDQPAHPLKGSGILKARDALDLSFDRVRATAGTTLRWPERPTGAPRDFFDGQRSTAKLLQAEGTSVSISSRADFRWEKKHMVTDPLQRQQALETIYFNMGLIQEWNRGHVPLKTNAPAAQRQRLGRDEGILDAEARDKARWHSQPTSLANRVFGWLGR